MAVRFATTVIPMLLAGCAISTCLAKNVPPAPDPTYWQSFPCDIVEKRFEQACLTEHERAGIPPYETKNSAALRAQDEARTRAQRGDASSEESAKNTHKDQEQQSPNADDVAARAALDKHLAASLKDPSSAMQYSASDIVPCAWIASVPPSMNTSRCVCYQVNAKNSYGAYAGKKLSAVVLLNDSAPYVVTDLHTNLIAYPACANANLSKRDSSLIHALVEK